MEIITLAEARMRGLARYFTGRPCKSGHISERYTAGANCIVCHQQRMRNMTPEMRLRDAQAKRRWRLANPEKVREMSKNAKQRLKRSPKYKERKAVYMKRYFEKRRLAYIALTELGIKI